MKEHSPSQVFDPALAPPQAPEPCPCRILVVDKSSDLRMLYTDALASPGCQVDAAENVAAAWAALHTQRYHLLVTENDPPDLTGDELIGKLRCAGMELPVVMAASGWPTHEPALNATLQVAATIRKPFALEELLETVKHALRASVALRYNPRRRRRRPSSNLANAFGPATCP
jgi:DNA-binding NtrC family response regulator